MLVSNMEVFLVSLYNIWTFLSPKVFKRKTLFFFLRLFPPRNLPPMTGRVEAEPVSSFRKELENSGHTSDVTSKFSDLHLSFC